MNRIIEMTPNQFDAHIMREIVAEYGCTKKEALECVPFHRPKYLAALEDAARNNIQIRAAVLDRLDRAFRCHLFHSNPSFADTMAGYVFPECRKREGAR